VHSDTAEPFDEGSVAASIMLDLPAAFDVIDRPLKHLELSSGTKEKVWVKSYFTNSTHCVSVADKLSRFIILMYHWYPFSMHTKFVDEIIKQLSKMILKSTQLLSHVINRMIFD